MLGFDKSSFLFTLKFIVGFACVAFLTKASADFIFFSPSPYAEANISSVSAEERLTNKSRMALTAAALHTPEIIKLGFVGDIMLDRKVKESIIKNGGGDYRFPFWRALNELQNYDILFGNLEGPISAGGEDQNAVYSFRMDPAATSAIKFAGFDILSLANNHIGDWGGGAIQDTVNYLDKEGVAHVGAGSDPYSPKFLNVGETKFAFLAFTDVGVARGDIAFISKNNDVVLKSGIEKAKASADIVIVYFHFGMEYQVEPGADEVALAHRAIDLGADLVVGSHPHTIERVEKYKDKYIAYSLGNFVFDQDFAPLTMQGMLLEVDVKDNKILDINERGVKINQYFQPEIEK